jgi:phosphatidylinositol-3-phosphatase
LFPRRGIVAASLASLIVALLPAANRVQAGSVPAFDHVFVIVMENTSYSTIIGSKSAPYINSLVPAGALATSYYAVTHPSLPNYLALTGGNTFGVTSDCTTCWVSASNVADSLESAGSTWKAYMESMPSPCFVGDSYPYAQKHNPFIYFNDIRTNSTRCKAHVVPFTQLATDLTSTSTTPNFGFITPNMCNDMHDCSVATGDAWLKQQVPAILASPAFKTQNSLLALTWDEDDSSGTNHVPLILLGPGAGVGYTSSVHYNHYSLLHAIEAARGAATLTTNDAGASTMSDLYSATAPVTTTCTTAHLSPASQSAAAGATLSLTASSTGCSKPLYEYWVLFPSGVWSLIQGWGGPTFNWSTAGLRPGAYTVHAWANQTGDYMGRLEAFGSATLTLTACTSASVSPAAGSYAVGISVAFTASASGCTSPQYEFWLQTTDGAWHKMRGFSATTTWTWSSTGYARGTYHLHVWANTSGAYTGSFQVYGASTISLT